MIKVPTYTLKGTKTGETALPRDVFEAKVNLNLLAQVVHVYEERSHTGLRKAKTRAEVNRTGKKLYKQKGTGGARHGSRRAPIFVGGGVAHGPRPLRRILNLPLELKKKGRNYAFTSKAKAGEVVLVSGISKIQKTKEVADLIKKLVKDMKAKRFTFIISESAKAAYKFLRNLGEANVVFYKNASAFDIVNGGILILDKDIFKK